MDARERLLTRVCALSIAAGLMHGLVTSDHFAEWWGYGVFFLVAALAQSFYGAIPPFSGMVEGESVLRRWRPATLRAYLWAGILGNLAILALYVVTRTVGIPFLGPDAGQVEAVRTIDVLSKLLEVAVIVGLVLMLRSRPEPAPA
jgi:hypothetical protein